LYLKFSIIEWHKPVIVEDIDKIYKSSREQPCSMAKKCNICGNEAQYAVKDTSDFYCNTCAEEQFGELSLLVRVEDQAAKLKKVIDDKISTEHEGCDCDSCGCEKED
jgi:hypothetical protein